MVILANLNKNVPISYFFHGNLIQKLKNAYLSFKFFQKNLEHRALRLNLGKILRTSKNAEILKT